MPLFIPFVPKGISQVDMTKVEKIREKLREADSNKDGCFNKDELKNALKDLDAIFPDWRANRCLRKADADNDGQISGREIEAHPEHLPNRGYDGRITVREIEALIEYLLNHGYGN